MKSILIIANKGKLLNGLIQYMADKEFLLEIIVISKDDNILEDVLVRIKERIPCFDFLVYISGETKASNRMNFLNFQLPKKIHELVVQENKYSIFLGSLSQYGLMPYKQNFITNNYIPIEFYDEYSKTKGMFYLYLLSMSFVNAALLSPASILNSRRKQGSVYTTFKIRRFPILNRLFYYGGYNSYVYRYQIYKQIFNLLKFNKCQNINIANYFKIDNKLHVSRFKRLTSKYFFNFLYKFFVLLNLKKYSQKIVLLNCEIFYG